MLIGIAPFFFSAPPECENTQAEAMNRTANVAFSFETNWREGAPARRSEVVKLLLALPRLHCHALGDGARGYEEIQLLQIDSEIGESGRLFGYSLNIRKWTFPKFLGGFWGKCAVGRGLGPASD